MCLATESTHIRPSEYLHLINADKRFGSIWNANQLNHWQFINSRHSIHFSLNQSYNSCSSIVSGTTNFIGCILGSNVLTYSCCPDVCGEWSRGMGTGV